MAGFGFNAWEGDAYRCLNFRKRDLKSGSLKVHILFYADGSYFLLSCLFLPLIPQMPVMIEKLKSLAVKIMWPTETLQHHSVSISTSFLCFSHMITLAENRDCSHCSLYNWQANSRSHQFCVSQCKRLFWPSWSRLRKSTFTIISFCCTIGYFFS